MVRTYYDTWGEDSGRPVLADPNEIAAVVAYVRDRINDDRKVWDVVVESYAVDLDLLSASLRNA
ncbi:MAG: hypothetical protein KDJ16_18355 [Hyphomicrobiales bacterium]|nr:hypothetical protein [Hyphomicrobiales bacterium]